MTRFSLLLTPFAVLAVVSFVGRSLLGAVDRGLTDLLEVVAYASVFMLVFLLAAGAVKAHVNRRSRKLAAERPSATVVSAVRTSALIKALMAADYQDELGAGLQPKDMSVSLDFVFDESGFEIWGGRVASPRLYMRTPWTDVRSVEARSSVGDSRRPGLVIEVKRDGIVELPVQAVGSGANFGPERLETLKRVAGIVSGHIRSSHGRMINSRNSSTWLQLRNRLRESEPISAAVGANHWEFDELASEVLDARSRGAEPEAALIEAVQSGYSVSLSARDAAKILGAGGQPTHPDAPRPDSEPRHPSDP
jgi:hypothetical protein